MLQKLLIIWLNKAFKDEWSVATMLHIVTNACHQSISKLPPGAVQKAG